MERSISKRRSECKSTPKNATSKHKPTFEALNTSKSRFRAAKKVRINWAFLEVENRNNNYFELKALTRSSVCSFVKLLKEELDAGSSE